MNVKKDEVFNRLSGLLDQGKDKMQAITDDLEDRFRTEAEAMAERARGGLKQGHEQFRTAEEMMRRNAKDHPLLFILGALSIVGLAVVIGRLFCDQDAEEEW